LDEREGKKEKKEGKQGGLWPPKKRFVGWVERSVTHQTPGFSRQKNL